MPIKMWQPTHAALGGNCALNVECNILRVELPFCLFYELYWHLTRIFHHTRAPPHERGRTIHSKSGHIHEHTPYRNKWESTLTAKLALALPLILPLLPNAGMLCCGYPALAALAARHGRALHNVPGDKEVVRNGC